MTLGRQLRRPELPTAGARWCEAALPEGSVYRFLARERARLFPPELFADLFQPTGRRSVPPSILAVVMVLQRLEGLSDREAANRFAFDVRWRYAAGVADAVAGEETASFAHTVLVDLRARLRRSADPDRIFRVTCDLARQVGLVGVKRVLDSAPLEVVVTTQDTVTMLRGAIRGLLRACPPALEAKVRGLLQRDDDYRAPGKPACDWQPHRAAREALVDALVRDGYRAHYALRGERLEGAGGRGGRAAGHGDRPRHRGDRRRALPDLRRDHTRPGHLDGGSPGPPRPQDRRARLRRLQRSPRSRPRQRGHLRCRGEPGSHRRRGGGAQAVLTTWSQAKASRPPRRWSIATAPTARAPTWPGWRATG